MLVARRFAADRSDARTLPAIPGDVADQTYSEWTLELVGVSGTACTLSWRALRKWNGSQVVYEHHYDQQQIGGPLTLDDLSFNAAKPALEARLS